MNPKIISRIIVGLVSAVILFFILSCFSVISPGNVGVIFNVWSGSLRTVHQGMAWKLPWITQVQSYPIALRTYTMVLRTDEGSSKTDDSVDLPTREGQHIKQDISVTYNTSEANAAHVFRAFRGADISDIESTFIRRTIITAAQNVAGQMSLSELISSKREELQSSIQKILTVEINKMGFDLDKVNLGASHLPASLEEQMQKKMAAQQQAQQAEYELQKNKMLAKAEVAKAEGDAQSNLVRARAQAAANKLLEVSLTEKIIKNRAVDKWNGEFPQVMGAGALPFLNMNLSK